MSNKLQEYALMAEIFGGVAIVFSLAFVGFQINQNTEMMRAQTRDSISDRQVELYLALGSNMDAMEIYTKGRAGLIRPDGKDPEYTSWEFMAFANLRAWENEWYQYEKGLFEEKEYAGRRDLLSVMLIGSGYAEVWETYKWQFSPGFQAYVDSLPPPQSNAGEGADKGKVEEKEL